jgi:hypothetical protein
MLNIDTRTADKKTTYSTFCRAIAIRAVHPHSFTNMKINFVKSFDLLSNSKNKPFPLKFLDPDHVLRVGINALNSFASKSTKSR